MSKCVSGACEYARPLLTEQVLLVIQLNHFDQKFLLELWNCSDTGRTFFYVKEKPGNIAGIVCQRLQAILILSAGIRN